jgi:hypothetical protein
LGQRSRKRRASAATREARGLRGEAAPRNGNGDAAGDAMARGYARSRARADDLRAGLEPLAPGERPLAITVAAVLAALLALANVVVYLAGWDVGGSEPSLRGLLSYCAVLGGAAVGMWFNRYWAVLGFQMLLAGSIIIAALFLLRASNWQAVAFCVGVLAVCGPLFWFLIRAMARLQMPSRTR